MATYSLYSIVTADNDANFRIFGKAISDALQAVGGIVKLSAGDSSGQIDWATVAKPAANTAAGYEMYKFADSLQTSYPVYIKFEWGSGTSGNMVSMWVTVAFAHNGAGTLTGFSSTRYQYTTSQNYAVPTYATSHLSAATNRLACLLRCNPGSGTNQPWALSVERTHAANGSDTNYGVLILIGNGGLVWYNYIVTFVSGQLTGDALSKPSLLCQSSGTNASAGGVTTVFPIWAYAGPFLCPHGGFVFAFANNITSGVPFSVTLLGTTKTFMPRKSDYDSGLTPSSGSSVNMTQCVRWD